MKDEEQGKSSRRNFLKNVGAGVGVISVTGIAGVSLMKGNEAKAKSGTKVKLLSPDGNLVEVDQDDIKPAKKVLAELKEEARTGLPNRKFAMVIDLARCKNARKCVDACQEGHLLPKDHEWIKLYLLQDDYKTAKYWFPRPCFHCDKPMCVTACPMGVIYFGDILEDTITNGVETVRFSRLMLDRAGYRYREELGTLPSVYYLPPSQRMFPMESGLEGFDESITGRYKNVGPR